MVRKPKAPKRICGRRSKRSGEPCKNAPLAGQDVCRMHGGATKASKEAARRRLDEAADRLARQLLKMTTDPSVSDSVKLAAIKDALDRIPGLSARTAHEVEVTSKPFEELLGRVVGIGNMTREESRRRRGRGGQLPAPPRALASGKDDPNIVDAEVLEEPVGGWRDEAHDSTETGPGSSVHAQAELTGVTGPDDGPPSATGPAATSLAALAEMTDEQRAILARTEGRANLRDRQSGKDAAAWEADNKSRKAAGEAGTEVRHHGPPITHTREQAAADMREQRGTSLRRAGNQARYDAEHGM
nr:HGGxSTG domain-containing protein [Mycolicibacterium holsaticum]